ncbi:MAG: serine hydrolase [Lachnospiraceae bacterium]|nr:serine hydrolase [Lachnospiraceae bacterium]MDE6184580.1 serine hydrolase [Lachnospiraceae bacterium]
MNEQLNDEEEIRARHRQRIEQMRRDKERQMMYRRYFKKYTPLAAGAFVLFVLILVGMKLLHKPSNQEAPRTEGAAAEDAIADGAVTDAVVTDGIVATGDALKENVTGAATLLQGTEAGAIWRIIQSMVQQTIEEETLSGSREKEALGQGIIGKMNIGETADQLREDMRPKVYTASATADTLQLGDTLKSGEEFFSSYAILVDMDEDSILAEKYARTRMNPASMTKVLTALVAAEHVEDLDDTFTMTLEITDYGYVNDCSSAGFMKDEVITVRDLFYGTILPSGADAAVGLATYVAGSHEAFVELMNKKLEELGLSETAHFTNCVGIYDEDHYCSVYDMAMIMEAAMDNELCREVMSAHTYNTSETPQHPDGILLSNWFLRRIEDKDCGGEVICGKTGYVVQSGSCAVSYAEDQTGKHYICVSANAGNKWRCTLDHARLYKQFLDAS